VHVPVAYLAMLLLIGVITLASRHECFGRVRHLAITVALALLANAFVCGALSNPHDRYGARMVWLAVLILLLTPWTAASVPVSAVRDASRQTLKRASETKGP
jgi:peptidoglycan/LPS O-acetylase OafA/YrhL